MNNRNKRPELAVFQTKKYRDARVEAHNALFWMARASHSFLEPTHENSHLSLLWNEEKCDFRTRLLVDGCRIGLHLPELELYFCENEEKVPHSLRNLLDSSETRQGICSQDQDERVEGR